MICLYKLNVFIQCILDRNTRFFSLIVPVADLVGDLVSHLYCRKSSHTGIRRFFHLHGCFRNRIFNDIEFKCLIISHLDSRSLSAVYDLSFAAHGSKCTLTYLYGYCNLA